MPGRGTIGIEVPNKNRETVFARSVLVNERFQKSNYDLPIVLGKDHFKRHPYCRPRENAPLADGGGDRSG